MATKTFTRRKPAINSENNDSGAALKNKTLLEKVYISSQTVDHVSQVTYFVFTLIEALLILRFVFKLSGTSPYNNFTSWLYSTTYPFVAGFESLFPSLSADGIVVELPSLVAMVIYILVVYAIVGFLKILQSNFKEGS
jgi:hypothetical protein